MKYIDYKENRRQGSFGFPIAYYRETPYTPRYEMQYHWHTYYELIHIVSGSFNLTLNSQTKEYHEGDVIFITDGVLHGGKPQNCIYECIVFDLQFLTKEGHIATKKIQDIVNHLITVKPHLSADSKKVTSIVEELTYTLSRKAPGYELTTQGLFYMLFGTIVNEHLYEKEAETTANMERLKSIKDVLAYISENYSSSITLIDLAKVAGMNSKYFCRYFRNMTGRTPIDYLNYYRIECACEMLSTKNISIKEAAISVGYNDESYFIKTFHKYKGITPKKYIQKDFV